MVPTGLGYDDLLSGLRPTRKTTFYAEVAKGRFPWHRNRRRRHHPDFRYATTACRAATPTPSAHCPPSCRSPRFDPRPRPGRSSVRVWDPLWVLSRSNPGDFVKITLRHAFADTWSPTVTPAIGGEIPGHVPTTRPRFRAPSSSYQIWSSVIDLAPNVTSARRCSPSACSSQCCTWPPTAYPGCSSFRRPRRRPRRPLLLSHVDAPTRLAPEPEF